jgi:hypothetical protein
LPPDKGFTINFILIVPNPLGSYKVYQNDISPSRKNYFSKRSLKKSPSPLSSPLGGEGGGEGEMILFQSPYKNA